MSQALLDTQAVLVAAGLGNGGIPKRFQALLNDSANELFISAASLFEVAVKNSIGKLALNEDLMRKLTADLALTVIPVTPQHAYRVFSLPFYHKDPFDRLIIATALIENLPIVGNDRSFRRYGVQLIW